MTFEPVVRFSGNKTAGHIRHFEFGLTQQDSEFLVRASTKQWYISDKSEVLPTLGDHVLQSDGLVSIIVVAHNNWPDLELAIHSALHQSYAHVEVIVVDNSSSDATGQLVPKLFGSRIRYVRQPNTGEGGGRNTGIRLAKGDFVQFLDGDDCLAPNKVEKQIAMLNASPDVDVVYGDVRQFQSTAGRATWEDWDGQDYPDMLATLLSPQGNGAGLLPDSVLFRRRALELVGPWVENSPSSEGEFHAYVGSDQDYWLRTAWAGCRFRYCPGSLCFYRRRPSQLTSSPRAALRGMEPVLIRAREYITQEPYRTAVSQRLGHILFYLAVSEKDSNLIADLAKLRKARDVSPSFVTLPAYAIGWLLIVTRAGPFVFGRWLKPVRQLTASLAGMKKLG
jgi:glycosyltransferase involved in cell wall biosynthesis